MWGFAFAKGGFQPAPQAFGRLRVDSFHDDGGHSGQKQGQPHLLAPMVIREEFESSICRLDGFENRIVH
jgi:hypothetical protein